MYDGSKSASHTVVTGSLREAFIRSVLEGHLPSTASWSTGQIVGHAPQNHLSGQLDLILHSGELPQIHIHDGFIRLVPSDACIAVVEVKSEITTGKAANPKPKDTLSGALSSLILAKDIPRATLASATSPPAAKVPFHVVAFVTRVRAPTIVQAVYNYLMFKQLSLNDYWPDSIVVLRGAGNDSGGFGVFKSSSLLSLPPSAVSISPTPSAPNLTLHKVVGWQAVAALVSRLANEAAAFPSGTFRLERYIY